MPSYSVVRAALHERDSKHLTENARAMHMRMSIFVDAFATCHALDRRVVVELAYAGALLPCCAAFGIENERASGCAFDVCF